MTPLALALNAALLHLVWQGVAVAALLWLVLAALRKASASARYAVSCAALGLLAVLPVVTACMEYMSPIATERVPMERVPITLAVTAIIRPVSAEFDWLSLMQAWMVQVWACGVALLSMRLLWGYAKVSKLKRTGDPAELAVLAMVSRLSERVGVTRAVRVLVSALADGPSVIGALRPVVLLPAATLLGLTPDQLEAVLAHELAHIRRYDYLVNLVQMLIETLFFYHPAVWWISGRIRRERELCCDDIAVRCCGDAVVYARALTALERIRVMSPSLVLGVKDGPLMYRIQRLLGEAPREQGPSRLPGLIAILLAVACFSTDTNPVKAQAPLPQPPAPEAPRFPAVPRHRTPSAPMPSRTKEPPRVLAQVIQPSPTAPPASVPVEGPVTVHVTIDQNGDVSDARVVSGPMSQRRSALLMALGMRFPDAPSTTREFEVLANTPQFFGLASGVRRVVTADEAQERISAASTFIAKMRAQQAEASERGATQLQETIDANTRGIDDMRKILSGQNPLVGKTLESIRITGYQISDSAREQLLAQLPVRLHDVLSDVNTAAAISAAKAIYPHADVYFGTIEASGQGAFLVQVPTDRLPLRLR